MPGVYFFEDENKEPLYIGKSINLRSRLKQHYEGFQKRNTKAFHFIPKTKHLYLKTFQNDIQAIIAESNYIKTFEPKYNSVQKDGKSNLYLVFTNQPQTKLVFARATDIADMHLDNYQNQVYGPYTSTAVASILQKQIRRTFGLCLNPFNSQNKACFNYHLQQCPGACIGLISSSQYQKILGLAKKFLSGQFTKLQKFYLKNIDKFSKNQDYENASNLKSQYLKLMSILESGNTNLLLKLSESTLSAQRRIVDTLNHPKLTSTPSRIECYDLAHTQGKDYVGAMSVSENGYLAKQSYRKFHIKDATSDPFAMREIVQRRLQHPEWPLPQLIVLDGGKPQLNITLPIIPDNIAVIALAKKRETIYYYDNNDLIELNLSLDDPVLNQFILLRNEVHRFGNKFHRKQRSKSSLM